MVRQNVATKIFMLVGSVVGLWAVAAFVGALAHSNWQVSEVLRQYLIAIGVLKNFNTLVDFTTHIKGIEYILAVTFLCLFPAYYKTLNKSPEHETEAARI